ncbi:unnamed protein product, partial [Ectocarpus sp. 12 AP-2014]
GLGVLLLVSFVDIAGTRCGGARPDGDSRYLLQWPRHNKFKPDLFVLQWISWTGLLFETLSGGESLDRLPVCGECGARGRCRVLKHGGLQPNNWPLRVS